MLSIDSGPIFRIEAKAFSAADALPRKNGIAVIVALFNGGPLNEKRKSMVGWCWLGDIHC